MSENLNIRPYIEGDEKEILELFSLSYGGRQMTLPYWLWRFRNNPSGQGVIELAWEGNLLVAHYAITSVYLYINGQDYLTGLSGTTMTHPSYRGCGLFPELARCTYKEMLDRRMPMVWGFPNTMSHRTFVCELGWQDICVIPVLRLQLEHPCIASHLDNSYVCELPHVDERFDRFWRKVKNDYDIIVRRDRDYIDWRYFSNPIEKYSLIAYMADEEILGYAVFKRYLNELQIVDILTGKDTVDAGKNLIAFIIAKSIKLGANSVSLWLNVTHPLHHALEKMGFRPEGPVMYLGGLLLNQTFDKSTYDFRRWYFTMGDSDVF